MVKNHLNIGIIGLGTVGSGVVETLEKKNSYFNWRKCKKNKV